jgi:hypothetical protein
VWEILDGYDLAAGDRSKYRLLNDPKPFMCWLIAAGFEKTTRWKVAS